MRVYPSLPLLNFLGLLLLAVQRGSSDLYKQLAKHYAPYVKEVGTWDDALAQLGEMYFGIRIPRPGNPLMVCTFPNDFSILRALLRMEEKFSLWQEAANNLPSSLIPLPFPDLEGRMLISNMRQDIMGSMMGFGGSPKSKPKRVDAPAPPAVD